MELDLTKLMIEAGALGLAAFVIKQSNQVWADRVRAAERYANSLQVLTERLTDALVANTQAMTRLEERLGGEG